ncbi:hypothetical protein AYI70_g7373 [Smittium culicis]|uniref:Uncharacterized protein n=1 Tax=Smittium culicis TaxID=133412 RepID=A0A1R1XHV8_9FUNG|nr:hypothetical protein AYI70_g8032 [Smittium culicis]OMJ15290.1 hypothetical protein AYI70_g7373 [Smittium culicis]
MGQIRQSVLVPTMESDRSASSKGPPRAIHDTTSESNEYIRNMFPRPDGAINLTDASSLCNNCSAGSKKRKATALGKILLDFDGLEEQWRFIELKGIEICAI